MTEEYLKGHAVGYANGIRDTQPEWHSTDEQNPEVNDYYWSIGEFTEDCAEWKAGDLLLNTMSGYIDGFWVYEDALPFKMLYWAMPPIITPPRALMGKPLNSQHWIQAQDRDFLDDEESADDEEDEDECMP